MGRATVDEQRATFADTDSQKRAEAILWLVPDAAVEFEVGRVQGINLSHDGIMEVYRDLPIGMSLANGYRWWGVREGRPTLKGADGHLSLIHI